MSSAPITRTWTQLREILNAKDPLKVSFPKIAFWAQSSAGLEIVLEYPTGYVFYTVTDLSLGIVRRGSETLTVAASALSATVNITLDPALTGAITDYLIFVSTNEANDVRMGIFNWVVNAELTSLSNLFLRLQRNPRRYTASSWDTNAGDGAGHIHTAPAVDELLTITGEAAGPAVPCAWMIIRA